MSEVDEEVKLAKEALKDLKHMENVSLRRKYTTLYSSSTGLMKMFFETK